MTNEEIIRRLSEEAPFGISHITPYMLEALDLARADEREKMKADIERLTNQLAERKEVIAGKQKTIEALCLAAQRTEANHQEYINKFRAEQPSTMTEAEFELAKQGAEIEKHDGSRARVICWDLKVENDTSIIVSTDVADMEALRGYTRYMFMRDFRLRTTKREGWVCFVPKGNKIYTTKEGAQDRCEIAGGVPARITWNEPKKEE